MSKEITLPQPASQPIPVPKDIQPPIRPGDRVFILHGRHKDQIGIVLEIKEKSQGLAAKIDLNNKELARFWMAE